MEHYFNRYNQMIRVGDTVVYPRWQGTLGRGVVTKIDEYEDFVYWGGWQAEKQFGFPEHRVQVLIDTTKWTYDPVARKGSHKPVKRKVYIQNGHRVIRPVEDEV